MTGDNKALVQRSIQLGFISQTGGLSPKEADELARINAELAIRRAKGEL